MTVNPLTKSGFTYSTYQLTDKKYKRYRILNLSAILLRALGMSWCLKKYIYFYLMS